MMTMTVKQLIRSLEKALAVRNGRDLPVRINDKDGSHELEIFTVDLSDSQHVANGRRHIPQCRRGNDDVCVKGGPSLICACWCHVNDREAQVNIILGDFPSL